MFIKEVKKYVPQQSYNWKVYLSWLQKINIENIEWRFLYMLELLKIADSVKAVKLYDWIRLVDVPKLKTLLWRSLSYYNNLNMIRHMVEESCTEISFEISSDAYTEESYKLIPKIISWEIDVKEFFNSKEWEDNNPLWVLEWKSWKAYSWKWWQKLFSLNTEEVLDIINNINTDDELLKKSIEHFLNNQNEYKKYFWQVRTAWIFILKKFLLYIDIYLYNEYIKRVEQKKQQKINEIWKNKSEQS